MQYIFWQTVVIGGLLTGKPLAAKLLNHSLALFGEEPEDLTIDDEETIRNISDTETFKSKVRELVEKYSNTVAGTDLKNYKTEGILLNFEEGDLLYALHDATMFVDVERNKNSTWNLKIEVNDTYDFKDFKNLEEYTDGKNSILTDIFSTLLNNFGVVSSEYGVIKTYDVKIKISLDNYIVE